MENIEHIPENIVSIIAKSTGMAHEKRPGKIEQSTVFIHFENIPLSVFKQREKSYASKLS